MPCAGSLVAEIPSATELLPPTCDPLCSVVSPDGRLIAVATQFGSLELGLLGEPDAIDRLRELVAKPEVDLNTADHSLIARTKQEAKWALERAGK